MCLYFPPPLVLYNLLIKNKYAFKQIINKINKSIWSIANYEYRQQGERNNTRSKRRKI